MNDGSVQPINRLVCKFPSQDDVGMVMIVIKMMSNDSWRR